MKGFRDGFALRKAGLLVRDIETETIIYDPVTSNAVHLDDFSASILNLCDGMSTIRYITRKLSEKYQDTIDPYTVRIIIEELHDKGLIRFLDELGRFVS